MDTDFLLNLIMAITEEERDKALSNELYEMCNSLHSHCPKNECLMRTENLVKKENPDTLEYTPLVAVYEEDDCDDEYGCPFFKNGVKMLRALKRINKEK